MWVTGPVTYGGREGGNRTEEKERVRENEGMKSTLHKQRFIFFYVKRQYLFGDE